MALASEGQATVERHTDLVYFMQQICFDEIGYKDVSRTHRADCMRRTRTNADGAAHSESASLSGFRRIDRVGDDPGGTRPSHKIDIQQIKRGDHGMLMICFAVCASLLFALLICVCWRRRAEVATLQTAKIRALAIDKQRNVSICWPR